MIAIDIASELRLQRRRPIAQFWWEGGRQYVDAVADDDSITRSAARRLGEDAAEFAARDLKVVRPLEIDAEAAPVFDALRDPDAGGERHERRCARRINWRGRRRQHHRRVDARARRRKPRVAAAAAARRLLVGHDNEAFGGDEGLEARTLGAGR